MVLGSSFVCCGVALRLLGDYWGKVCRRFNGGCVSFFVCELAFELVFCVGTRGRQIGNRKDVLYVQIVRHVHYVQYAQYVQHAQ